MIGYIEAVLNGILMGSIYGLTAVGLTLIFGVMKVVNFAHGSILMVGMFAAYWFVTLTGLNPYLALLFVVPLLYVFGYMMQKIVIKPIFEAEKNVREPSTVIIVTTGIWYVLDNLALLVFGAQYRVAQTSVTGKMVEFMQMYFPLAKIIGAGITVLLGVYLFWFLKYSKMGKAVRATSLDREAATLMGIKQSRIYNIVFGMGCASCGVAACVLVPFYYVYPTVGVSFDIKAFVIVVLGGLGSIPGAILGGIIIGVIETLGAQFMAATWTEMLIYAFFLVILFVKPSGLFGLKQDY